MRRSDSANSQYENILQQKTKTTTTAKKKLQRAMRTGDLATKEDIFKNFELQLKRKKIKIFYPWYFRSNPAFPGRHFKHVSQRGRDITSKFKAGEVGENSA